MDDGLHGCTGWAGGRVIGHRMHKGHIPSLPLYEERKRPSRRTFLQNFLNLNSQGIKRVDWPQNVHIFVTPHGKRKPSPCLSLSAVPSKAQAGQRERKWPCQGDRKLGVEQLRHLKDVISLPLKRSNDTASGHNDAWAIGQSVRRSAFSLTR